MAHEIGRNFDVLDRVMISQETASSVSQSAGKQTPRARDPRIIVRDAVELHAVARQQAREMQAVEDRADRERDIEEVRTANTISKDAAAEADSLRQEHFDPPERHLSARPSVHPDTVGGKLDVLA